MKMEEAIVEAENRVALGKKVGALRRSGITPIHVYGKGGESLSLQADTYNLIKTLGIVGHTSPLTVRVGNDEHFVMVQGIQRHPVTERLLHVDLLRISRTEKVHASVPLHFQGESLGARGGAHLSEDMHEVEVEALPSEIPHDLIVDISVMDSPDSVIRAGDLSLPAGVTLVTDPDSFIARVIQRRGATAATSAEEATAPSGEEIAVSTNTVSDTTEPESSEGSSEEAEVSTEEAD
tara:strand:- start:2718 stop:3425 length:708 start_codon:yes stop_codon:yes gene_type:complete